MKINTPRNSNKKIRTTLSIVIILALIAFAVIYFLNNRSSENATDITQDNKSVNFDKPTSEQIDAGETIKQKAIENYEQTSNNKTAPDSVITITAVNTEGNSLEIRTLINALWADGSCTLTLTNGSVTKKYSSSIGASSSSSSCNGFSIPRSELSSGQWNAHVTATHNDLTISTQKSISL